MPTGTNVTIKGIPQELDDLEKLVLNLRGRLQTLRDGLKGTYPSEESAKECQPESSGLVHEIHGAVSRITRFTQQSDEIAADLQAFCLRSEENKCRAE